MKVRAVFQKQTGDFLIVFGVLWSSLVSGNFIGVSPSDIFMVRRGEKEPPISSPGSRLSKSKPATPCPAASIRSVMPLGETKAAFAPARSKSRTSSGLPVFTATRKAAMPLTVAWFTLAPARRRADTRRVSPPRTASGRRAKLSPIASCFGGAVQLGSAPRSSKSSAVS